MCSFGEPIMMLRTLLDKNAEAVQAIVLLFKMHVLLLQT